MWTTAVADLRNLLSDGPTDRFRFRQRVFGELNGTNQRYKTFEFRRVTDFTLETGVYLNGNILPITGVSADVLSTGEFFLVTPPVDGDIVEASYYSQWFIDAELQDFLITASRWLLSTDDFTTVPDGLVPSALKYSVSEAYLKMAQRWRDYASSGYKVEDAPNKAGTGPVDSFVKMAEIFREEALKSRDEFYRRQGQALQPLFASIPGRVRSMP